MKSFSLDESGEHFHSGHHGAGGGHHPPGHPHGHHRLTQHRSSNPNAVTTSGSSGTLNSGSAHNSQASSYCQCNLFFSCRISDGGYYTGLRDPSLVYHCVNPWTSQRQKPQNEYFCDKLTGFLLLYNKLAVLETLGQSNQAVKPVVGCLWSISFRCSRCKLGNAYLCCVRACPIFTKASLFHLSCPGSFAASG